MVRPNPTYTHLPQALIALRIPLFQCFQPKLANLKLDYDSNKIFGLMTPLILLDYGSKTPFIRRLSRKNFQTLSFRLWYQNPVIRNKNKKPCHEK